MNIEYVYLRARGLFGKPYQFVADAPILVESVNPDKALESKYIPRARSNKGVQGTPTFAVHEANTGRTEFSDRGMYHDQGGWPKEVNIYDEESIHRYKKKIVKEDNYIQALKTLTKPIEHAVLQNNTINIYQKYFENEIQTYADYESLSQIRSVYHNDVASSVHPVSHLSWSPGKESNFVASYCDLKFQTWGFGEETTQSCVWNVEIPSAPQVVFDSGVPIVSMEWNPSSRNFLIGGLVTGKIGYYDLRKAPKHVDITSDEVSHRDPVHSVLWLASKSGFDFFSASSDGEIKWWDCRYLYRVLDSIILDVKSQNITNSYPASILQYDPAISAKYLVGTENGYVFLGNRKGVTLSEKFAWVMKTHSGPLCGLERNPSCLKYFLTIGCWDAKIWAEDCRESPIIWTNQYKSTLTSGGWSRSRSSVFFLTRNDGYLDVWDLLQEQKAAVLSLRVSDWPLTAFRMEKRSRLSIVGDDKGDVHLIQYGKSLSTFQKNEKLILSSMFDREDRRENIIETKMREVRYAMRQKAQSEARGSSFMRESDLRTERLKAAEEAYLEQVHKKKKGGEENKKHGGENQSKPKSKLPTKKRHDKETKKKKEKTKKHAN